MNLRPVIVSRRSKGTRRPELTLSPGPAHLAQPGAGSYPELYGCPWALALHRDGPQLYQLTAGEWVPRADPGGALVGLVRGVRWAGLAWDQAARPVIAWELDGAVFIRQWDALAAQYATRGPWAGCDPVLLADALTTGDTADSDVVLYHLTADRAQIVARVQRDVYGVARTVADVTPGAVLDQVVALPYRWQLLGEAAAGRVVLRSDLYPIPAAHAMTGAATLTGGELFAQIVTRPAGDGMTGAAALTGGDVFAQLDTRPAAHAMTGAAALTGGDVFAQMVTRPAAHSMTGAAALTGGASDTVLILRTAGDGMTGACVLTGGSYV